MPNLYHGSRVGIRRRRLSHPADLSMGCVVGNFTLHMLRVISADCAKAREVYRFFYEILPMLLSPKRSFCSIATRPRSSGHGRKHLSLERLQFLFDLCSRDLSIAKSRLDRRRAAERHISQIVGNLFQCPSSRDRPRGEIIS
jgi:hypothetical protein